MTGQNGAGATPDLYRCKACPRCGGALAQETEWGDTFWHCLNCARNWGRTEAPLRLRLMGRGRAGRGLERGGRGKGQGIDPLPSTPILEGLRG